jgi:hypothetical protein
LKLTQVKVFDNRGVKMLSLLQLIYDQLQNYQSESAFLWKPFNQVHFVCTNFATDDVVFIIKWPFSGKGYWFQNFTLPTEILPGCHPPPIKRSVRHRSWTDRNGRKPFWAHIGVSLQIFCSVACIWYILNQYCHSLGWSNFYFFTWSNYQYWSWGRCLLHFPFSQKPLFRSYLYFSSKSRCKLEGPHKLKLKRGKIELHQRIWHGNIKGYVFLSLTDVKLIYCFDTNDFEWELYFGHLLAKGPFS